MSIRVRLLIGYLLTVALLAALALYAVHANRVALTSVAGEHSVFLAEELLKRIDQQLYNRLLLGASMARNSSLVAYLQSAEPDAAGSEERARALLREFIQFEVDNQGYSTVLEALVTDHQGGPVLNTANTPRAEQGGAERAGARGSRGRPWRRERPGPPRRRFLVCAPGATRRGSSRTGRAARGCHSRRD